MGLINKNTIKKVRRSKWPNPYGLTKSDLIGSIENMPLEVVTLALKETKSQRPQKTVKDLQAGFAGAFFWEQTADGAFFWCSIIIGDYDVFYDKYTPELLRKRLEE